MKKLKLSSLELRRQLMLMILLIFVPFICILVLSGYRQYNSAIQSARNDVLHLFDDFETDERHLVVHTRQMLELLSQVPAIRDMDIEGGNAFLQNIHRFYPQYSTIVVSDPSGVINICAIPLDEPIIVRDRSWYQRATDTGNFIVDRFIISRSSKRTSLPFAYPVLNSDGSIKFIVGAAFDLSYFERLFSGHPVPPDSEIILLDEDGIILYSSTEPDATGSSLDESTAVRLSEAGGKGISLRDSRGIGRYYWYRDISIGESAGKIRIIIGLSKKTVRADVVSSAVESSFLLIGVAVLSLVLVRGYGRKMILNPVNSLLEKTRRIQAWDFRQSTRKTDYPGELQMLSDEIDLLAAALNKRDCEVHEAELALKESAQRIRFLFDKAADDIFVADETGRLIEVNSQAVTETGYLKEELLGMNVWDIDAEQSTKEGISDYFNSLDPGMPVKIESKHRRKNGTQYPVEVTIVKLTTSGGIMVIGIARNISERMLWQENIQRSLNEKEILLKELYHRTKNNMEVIRSMLNLNSSRYEIPEMNEIIISTGHRIEAMSLVHQMLYQSENLSKISLTEYMKNLAESVIGGLYSGHTEIRVNMDAEEIDLIIDVAVPLGLVMNEILMNSCKHAFTDRDVGNINIQASQDDENIFIRISDDGKGLPEDFIHDPSESLGMTIVNGIIEHQLSGEISLSGECGVAWSIKFPREIYNQPAISSLS